MAEEVTNSDQNVEIEQENVVEPILQPQQQNNVFGQQQYNPHYNMQGPFNNQIDMNMMGPGSFNTNPMSMGFNPHQMQSGYNMFDAQVMQSNNSYVNQPPIQQQNVSYNVGSTSSPNKNAVHPWGNNGSQQYQGTLGEEVTDVSTMVEPGAPPPPSVKNKVPGYEGTMSFDEVASSPPPLYEDVVQEVGTIDAAKIKAITVKESRKALLEYVAQQSCYGRGAANEMFIKEIEPTSACHYTLETFTESRNTKWHQVPYSGGLIDGPELGRAPGAWEINCQFLNLFNTETKFLEIPHTSTIRLCHVCNGRGLCRCWHCRGHGRVRCSYCHGSGHRSQYKDGHHERTMCTFCYGNGRVRCSTCNSNGSVKCKQCSGYGKMRQFIQLIVNFTNRKSDYIIERSDMPDHLIRDVEGDVVFEQTAFRVAPIQNFSDDEINKKSEEIVQQHSSAWPSERIIQQRQILKSVPVYECKFKFKSKEGRFWVYGHQQSVFTEEYPHTCLCCNIL